MNHDVYLQGLRLLGKKSYTSFELGEKLRKKYPTATSEIPLVLRTLEEEGLLNDARYVESFVASAMAHRTWSLRMLRNKLLRRGIDATLLQKYLSDPEHYDERVLLVRLWSKIAIATPTNEERVKFIQAMERKGFFLSTILSVVHNDEQI